MMRRFLRNTSIAASVVAIAIVPAAWAESPGPYGKMRHGGAMTETEDQVRTKSRQVSGRVTQTKEIEVRGDNGQTTKNLVVQIRTSKGNEELAIDLGPAHDMRNRLRRGSEIAVEGPVVVVDDKPLLVAERVKFEDNGQSSIISRNEQESFAERGVASSAGGTLHRGHGRMDDAPATQSRQVSGEVLMIKDVEIRGTETHNKVAMLSTTRGEQRILVDFGPAAQADEIRKGVEVKVEGPVRLVDGRPVIVAQRFRLGGETTTVDRSAETRAATETDTAAARD
jgi:hypothetical protein